MCPPIHGYIQPSVLYKLILLLSKKVMTANTRPTERQNTVRNSDIRILTKLPYDRIFKLSSSSVNLNEIITSTSVKGNKTTLYRKRRKTVAIRHSIRHWKRHLQTDMTYEQNQIQLLSTIFCHLSNYFIFLKLEFVLAPAF